jgi:hypothetical protein
MVAQAPRHMQRFPLVAQAPRNLQQPRSWGRQTAIRPIMPAPMTAWAPRTQWLAPARSAYRPMEAQIPRLGKAAPLHGKTARYRPEQELAKTARGAELAPPPGPYAAAFEAGETTDNAARKAGGTDIEFRAAFGAAEAQAAPVTLPREPG